MPSKKSGKGSGRGGKNRGSGKPPKKGGTLPKGKGRRGAQAKMPPEKYEKMWKAYCEKQEITHAAKQAGVCYKTAKKYIDGPGDPKRQMPPIHERWQKMESDSQNKADRELVKSRANNLKIVRLAKAKVAEKLMGNFDLDKISEDKVPAALKDLIQLEERLLGGDDVKIGVSDRSNEQNQFDGWTDEEIAEFARTGLMPAHAEDGEDASTGTK